MQLSREEVSRLAAFAHGLISFGVRAGISGAQQNPRASAEAIHSVVMEKLDPYIAQNYTAALIMAQLNGHVEVE